MDFEVDLLDFPGVRAATELPMNRQQNYRVEASISYRRSTKAETFTYACSG